MSQYDDLARHEHVTVMILSEIRRFDIIPYYRSLTEMLVRPRGTLIAC